MRESSHTLPTSLVLPSTSIPSSDISTAEPSSSNNTPLPSRKRSAVEDQDDPRLYLPDTTLDIDSRMTTSEGHQVDNMETVPGVATMFERGNVNNLETDSKSATEVDRSDSSRERNVIGMERNSGTGSYWAQGSGDQLQIGEEESARLDGSSQRVRWSHMRRRNSEKDSNTTVLPTCKRRKLSVVTREGGKDTLGTRGGGKDSKISKSGTTTGNPCISTMLSEYSICQPQKAPIPLLPRQTLTSHSSVQAVPSPVAPVPDLPPPSMQLGYRPSLAHLKSHQRSSSLPTPSRHIEVSSFATTNTSPISFESVSAFQQRQLNAASSSFSSATGPISSHSASLSLPSASTTTSFHLASRAKWDQSQILALHRAHEMMDSDAVLSISSLVPPITRTTLRELDLNEILRNGQLRHDVVFDPNLMFRPNVDGVRGERKRSAADQYWTSVSQEIILGCRCTTFLSSGRISPCVCLIEPGRSRRGLARRMPSRIGSLVLELRNILLSLLPSPPPPSPFSTDSYQAQNTEDQILSQVLMKVMDPPLMEIQVERGELEIGELMSFLGETLKLHCAPMRDRLVDAMVSTCVHKNELAKGLRMAFEILELMKLDIANHQLKSLRPYLLQNALEFEQKSFADFSARYSSESALPKTRSWILASADTLSKKTTSVPMEKASQIEKVVCDGLLDLIFPSAGASKSTSDLPSLQNLPESLQLDSLRLQSFHADFTDLTVVYSLLLLFQQMCAPARPTTLDIDTMRQEIWCIMSPNSATVSNMSGAASLGNSIPNTPSAAGNEKLSCPIWRKGMEDVLLQIGARATMISTRMSQDSQPGVQTSFIDSLSFLPPPSQDTLSLLISYFNSNITSSSPIFKLLQTRLRTTISLVVSEEFARESRGAFGLKNWWLPSSETSFDLRNGITSNRRSTQLLGGCKLRNAEMNIGEKDMASTRQTQNRKIFGTPVTEGEGDNVVLLEESPFESALEKNGLGPLTGEVQILGRRIARVASYHLQVYKPFYRTVLLHS